MFGFTAITDIYDDKINKDTKETSVWTVRKPLGIGFNGREYSHRALSLDTFNL